MDPDTTFTRQEIADRTGLSDDILSYWSKQGLLVAIEGGEGKGSHRRYDGAQINIAAILAVYREYFGANIGVLKSLSSLMQRSVATFRKVGLPLSEWTTVAALGTDLHDFRAGKPVLVRAHDFDDPDYDDLEIHERLEKRPALNEAEILAQYGARSDAPLAVVIRCAERIGPGLETEALVARLVDGILIDPEYVSEEMWLLRQDDDGWKLKWATNELEFNLDDARDFGPAAFIPAAAILRDVWNLPTGKVLRNKRYAEKLQAVLDKHQIKATVSPSNGLDDDGYYVLIDAPEKEWDVIAPLAKETIHYFAFVEQQASSSSEAGS